MENVILTDEPFVSENVNTAEETALTGETVAINAENGAAETSDSVLRERSREQTRGGARVLMTIIALCGAAAGVIAALSGSHGAEITSALGERISGGFGEIFLRRALSGCAILLVEFLLGFFAFGDLLSWILPVFAGMGAGFFVAALQNPVFLPSEITVLATVIFAGADSALFSRKLFGLSTGNRAYLRGMSAADYSARFALMALAMVAAGIYEGIAAVNFA